LFPGSTIRGRQRNGQNSARDRAYSPKLVGDTQHDRRIETAAHRDANRMRRSQTTFHRLKHQLAEPLGVVGVRREAHGGLRIKVPKSRRLQSACADGESMTGENGVNVLEERFAVMLLGKEIPAQIVSNQILIWS